MKKSNLNETGKNLRKQESVLSDQKNKGITAADRQIEHSLKAIEGAAEEDRRRRLDYQVQTPEELETRLPSGNQTISKASNSSTPIYKVQKQNVRKKSSDQPKEEFRRKSIVFTSEESDGQKRLDSPQKNSLKKQSVLSAGEAVKTGVNKYQETLENGDAEGVTIVSQGATRTLETTHSAVRHIREQRMRKSNTKIYKTEYSKLKKESSELKTEAEKQTEALEIQKKEHQTDKEKVSELIKSKTKLTEQDKEFLKKTEKKLNKDIKKIEEKEEDLDKVKEKLTKKNKDKKDFKKKNKKIVKKDSTVKKISKIPNAAMTTATRKSQETLENGDAEGVKLTSQGATAVARASKKLVKGSNKAANKTSKVSKRKTKANIKNKNNDKLKKDSHAALKKIQKKKMYAPIREKNKSAGMSISSIYNRVKDYFFKNNKGSPIAVLKELISSKMVAIFGGGAISAMPIITVSVIVMIIGGLFAYSGGAYEQQNSQNGFNGVYTETVPMFPEIKGTGDFPDEVAQLAVGTAVKYRLLPSVILSQWAYESMWGRSQSAKNDTNFFGITWFEGCPFPKGSARGVGGSEGGWYMKFPNAMACFSYYGYMVATQNNFNACVSNKSPSQCLLILGRGGYAAAGITETSPYFVNCMNIINNNKLVEKYDQFAIERWATFSTGGSREQFVELVTAQAGKPYVWGGKGPNEFDCSGLIYWALKQLGINYGGNSTSQWGMVERISESELKPGDLIFYGANASRHVSVYISPGRCFEAKSPSEGIGYGNYKNASDVCGYGRIKELSDGASGAAKEGLNKLEAVLGKGVYNGECYGLTAYYVDQVGGPKLMGSGKMYAWSIGTDYDWGSFGWQVILNPEYKDLQAGDVINWYGGGAISPGSYGHTGIIISVNGNGTFSTYEQNAEQGRVCAKYTRNMGSARIASLVRKK